MRPEKKSMVEELRGHIEKAEFIILADYRGLTVEQLAELRSLLRPLGTSLSVIKKSLFKRAAEAQDWKELEGLLEGPIAIAFGEGDICAAAKILKTFGKNTQLPAVKGGRLGQDSLSITDMEEIASLPPRLALLSSLVRTIAAPPTQLAGVLYQKLSSLVYVLKAIEEKKTN
jgi:large subunit ribosomal protein L10